MAKPQKLTYHGPPVRVVELDRDVQDGDTIEVEASVAGRLRASAGFEGGKSSGPDVELASEAELRERVAAQGLAVYETDDRDALASRLRSHGGDPTKQGPDAEELSEGGGGDA